MRVGQGTFGELDDIIMIHQNMSHHCEQSYRTQLEKFQHHVSGIIQRVIYHLKKLDNVGMLQLKEDINFISQRVQGIILLLLLEFFSNHDGRAGERRSAAQTTGTLQPLLWDTFDGKLFCTPIRVLHEGFSCVGKFSVTNHSEWTLAKLTVEPVLI